ncbi:MAG: ABC transporter permease [Gemmatimonadales bacterium]|nr:MAG: ABC transporter permease [Gemmatimonadales bacterium]
MLRRSLPPGARWDAVLGDLHEEYLGRVARTGALRAGLWYWREALATAGRYRLDRGSDMEHRPTGLGKERGGGAGMDLVIQNVRYAVRRMGKAPFFTLVAVLSLALGIGANTAIFSLVNAVLLQDVPLERPEELVNIHSRSPDFRWGTVSFPDYRDLEERARDVFVGVSIMELGLVQVDRDDGSVDPVLAEGVSGNYFSLAGLDPALGRLLQAEDHVEPGAHPVVVLGHQYWSTQFEGDPEVVGRSMRLSGREYTVVGVAPEAYPGTLRGLEPALYLPIYMLDLAQGQEPSYERRGNQSGFIRARLHPGVGIPQMEAALERVARELQAEYPGEWAPDKVFAYIPTADVIMYPDIDRIMVPAAGMLMVVVGLVLLIACANLASFLLARAADRRKEIAVRLAMGARRGTLVGQLLTETVLLSTLGGAGGILLSVWALRVLQGADLPLPIPITLDLSLNGTVLTFSVLVSVAAGIFFGLAPAIQGTNPAVAPTLRDESAGGGRARGGALRSALVVAQVAVSVVLLVGAGLFVRSLQASQELDPGFGNEPVAMLQLVAPAPDYSGDEAVLYFRQLAERVAALPGIETVSLVDNPHLDQLNTQFTGVVVDGVPPPEGRDFHTVDWAVAEPGYLELVGIPLVAGRDFLPSDGPDAEPVVIVSQAFADRFFPGQDALGRTFTTRQRTVRVVGVARDAKVRSLTEDPRPFLYAPLAQFPTNLAWLLAGTRGPADPHVLSLVREARDLDPSVIVYNMKTMEEHLASRLLGRELGAQVIGAFALLAMLLASIGLYGVVSYSVARRTREVGIRLSLGAETGAVVWMLTRGGMRLVALGAGIGLAVSGLLAQFLSRFLFGVPALDPVTFVGVPLLLGAVALLAAWIPAMRAARVNPVGALRAE